VRLIRYLSAEQQVGYASLQPDGSAYRLEGSLAAGLRETDELAEVVRLLAPVAPCQVIGVGLNYRRHAQEVGVTPPADPILFSKGVNTVLGPGQPIVLPEGSLEVDYEGELAVVIGESGKNIARENAFDHVLGYTCANDVSARDWQLRRGGGQWYYGKSFDTFCPLGPALVTPDEIPNPHGLRLLTTLNGQRVQDWHTGDMVFDIPSLIAFLSRDTTLPSGTVILTGTPHGVGMAQRPPRWLKAGDEVRVEIEGIGALVNAVEASL